MPFHLNPAEQRVVGALMEKEITTPEQYPLSLNALVNACNQRSSRDPVMDLDEETVRQALHALQRLGFVRVVQEGRVPKFENVCRTVLNLRRDEAAVICLLLLRGPQTPGELRSRADRLWTFEELSAVTTTLDRLAGRPEAEDTEAPATPNTTGPLIVLLPRQPGSREARYAHLLGGPVEAGVAASRSYGAADAEEERGSSAANELSGKVVALQATVAGLESTVATLQQRVEQLEVELQKLVAALS